MSFNSYIIAAEEGGEDDQDDLHEGEGRPGQGHSRLRSGCLSCERSRGL